MGHRAECVILNKGEHVRAAVRVLDDILRRMDSHQSKKRRCCASYGLGHRLDPLVENVTT
jgi:pyruvate kinase